MSMSDCAKGFIIGGVIGMALGLLYAPKSGKQTREEILHAAEDVLKKAKEQYENAAREIGHVVGREKEAFVGKKEKVTKALEAGVDAFKQEISQA